HRIPDHIRNLVSPDPLKRKAALNLLFGEGSSYGNIYESTAYIIPFALEILAEDTLLGYRAILQRFEAILKFKVHTASRDSYSIREVCNYLNAYTAIEQGLSVYVNLLVNQHLTVRADAARVLGSLNGSATSILPVLRDQFSVETSEETQTVLLEAMTRLLKEQ